MSSRQFGIARDVLQKAPRKDQALEPPDTLLDKQDAGQVTQGQLRELLHLERLAKRHEVLRRQVREAIQAGARIEPGMVGAYVRHSQSRQLSAAKLCKLLGEEQTAEIVNGIEPTTVCQLVIFEDVSQI